MCFQFARLEWHEPFAFSFRAVVVVVVVVLFTFVILIMALRCMRMKMVKLYSDQARGYITEGEDKLSTVTRKIDRW